MSLNDWEICKPSLLQRTENEGARVLLSHWAEIYQREGRLPRRKEIDPLAFMKYAPYIWIIERVSEERYLYRLVGDHIVKSFGMEVSGMHIDDIFTGEMLESIVSLQKEVMNRTAIALHHGLRNLPTCDYPVEFERLALPLADADGRVKYVIGFTFFYSISNMTEAILGETSVLTREEYFDV